MQNTDSKSCASRAIVRDLSKLVRNGELSRSAILKYYQIRKLAWRNAESQVLDSGGTTLKSLHTILQLGLFFRVGDRVAVFRRPSLEKDGAEKITSSFSILKSWSPTSLDEEDLAVDLAKKVHLNAGPVLKWTERGVASTDIFERSNRFAPHYLFLIYEVQLDSEERLSTKAHLDQRKSTELLAGWFNPKDYDASSFQASFFDPFEERNLTITFDGAVDRLVLTSLNRGDMESLEDTTRGLARYFPENNLINDTEDCDFPVGEIEVDDYMEDLLRIIEAIRASKGSPDMEVTLQDVVMFEPNFCGLGIRGPAFLKWIKKLYDRAFN
ncbi:hypothetical protein P4C99_19825 [Pontiellaceae bacterium B1224]|nr:hypothetical protein [Pontiellaceae bacterium B1224]